jgi:hypothetical protein
MTFQDRSKTPYSNSKDNLGISGVGGKINWVSNDVGAFNAKLI